MQGKYMSLFTSKAFKAIGAVAAISLVVGFVAQDAIVNNIMAKRIYENLGSDPLAKYRNTLTVGICGAGSPIYDPERSGACAVVIAGDQVLLLDSGSGIRQLPAMGLSPGLVDALFLTHFHSDHINATGELMTQRWAGSSTDQGLSIYGPEGVQNIVDGFNMAYAADRTYREAHHTTAVMPPSGGLALAHPFTIPNTNGTVLFENKGLKVIVFPVDHAPIHPAVGYKFEYKGRSVVFSGDTTKNSTVQKFATGSDLLVHEALSSELLGLLNKGAAKANRANIVTITKDILNYHTSPIEAAQVAAAAQVPFLLFSHIVPQLPIDNLKKRFVKGVKDVYEGEFAIAQDGTVISIDIKTGNISHKELIH
jgi:ribonuclease Z